MAKRGRQLIRPIQGMNLDVARELIPPPQSTFLKNVISNFNRNAANNGASNNIGVITPVLANVNNATFVGSLPNSQNVCIGTKYDRKLNQFFFFVWNIDAEDTIWVYSANDNTCSLIYKSNPSGLLNFSPRNLITSINVVVADISPAGIANIQNLQRLLYWTDGNNPPRKINVDTALAGGYNSITFARTDHEFMDRVKYPPLDVDLTTTLTNPDTTYLLNWIANKQFRFRYRYYYDDGEHSTWSAISSLYYSVDKTRNFIELSMDAGSSLVTYVELAFKLTPEANLGDWKSYDVISRADIIANTLYPYSNVTNIFKYKFFNNQAYNILDQDVTNRLFSSTPLKSYAQEFVEQNILLDGNILEGYDNIIAEKLAQPSVDVAYTTYAPLTLTIHASIPFTFSAGAGFTLKVQRLDINTGLVTTESTTVVTNGVTASPVVINTVLTDVDFGDIVYIDVIPNGAFNLTATRTISGTYSNIKTPLQCGTGDFSAIDNNIQTPLVTAHVRFVLEQSDTCNDWDIVNNQHTVPNFATGWSQLKQGGHYKFGIILYDEALRSTFVQPLADGDINIESIQKNSHFQTFSITINWNSIVFPDQFFAFKICRTRNLNINRNLGTGYLQFGINFDNGTDPTVGFVDYDGSITSSPTATTKKVKFKVTNLITFNATYFENTTTTYTWTQGDRIQFIRNGDGVYFNFTTYGLIDKELSTDPSDPDVTFICDYTAGLATLADGAWVEFYTPAKEDQTDIYYEIGDFILLTGQQGLNTSVVTSTTLRTWDTYPIYWNEPYVDDLVTDAGVTPFEHHSIYAEGTVPSNGEDIGRINVINKDARQLWYPARVRWSDAYLPNTFLNGLSMNPEENKKDYFRQYGGITQLYGDYYNLLLLQEDNCFRVVIARNLVTLADGTTQLVASNTFLSDPIVIGNENFGCQNSESFQEYGGLMFWVDTKKGAIVECDWQNTKDISRVGMVKSYAERKLKYIFNYNANEAPVCGWDMSHVFPSPDTYNFIFWLFSTTLGYESSSFNGTAFANAQAMVDYNNGFDIIGGNTVLGIIAGTNIVYVVSSDYTFANVQIINAITNAQLFDLPISCSNNFFTIPCGIDPKTQSYYVTFFRQLAPIGLLQNFNYYYSWNIGAFQTGSITISITINSVVHTGTFAINNIDGIVAALNTFAVSPDQFEAIENDTVITVIANTFSEYSLLVIGDNTYRTGISNRYQYTNNQYSIAISRNETFAWSLNGQFWQSFYSGTPEYYCFNDANLEGISLIQFKVGTPWFSNLQTTTEYNRFFGFYCDQVINIVCNESPQTKKRFLTIMYDSRDQSQTTSVKYLGYKVITSNNQESSIPIQASIYKEGALWAVFYRNTALGGTLQTGQQMTGNWLEVTLVRDSTDAYINVYSEFALAVIEYFTSERTY